VTLSEELSQIIKMYSREHGRAPTHIFVPGAKYDIPDTLTSVQGVRVIELLDPAIKTIHVGILQTYAVATR